MKRGRVIGEVWGTRRAPGIDGRRLLLVAERGADRVTVAMDTLDARVGQEVLLAYGSGARNAVLPSGAGERGLLCDAAVALLVDDAEGDA